ncbi:molybdopterin guanine dinucleotide-containing S/N-oxide reductase [Helicobacter pametensis]|uniref:molybdopterin guanine dinucleotide-containing S/N-oxide reductase n=1 Tax=Helicobacter pametensis TaxID=95149 RepID=UPI0004B2D0A1|nr:molybdopterin guanine dinucleotide-containing S/N-oxide reductase [Helicobacter pametensis]
MKTQINHNRRNLLKYAGLFASIPFVSQLTDKSTLLAAGANKFSTDLVLNGEVYTAAHWGIIKVKVKNGKAVVSSDALSNSDSIYMSDGKALNSLDMRTSVPDLIDGKRANRIKAPMVRKSYLEKKSNHRELRGNDEWVEISYEQAIKLVSDEVKRIRKEKGASGIYGGSYGWQSSGKLHSARTLLHRFLTMGGGFVGGLGDYSTGAAQVIMPHVMGTLEVYEQQTSWPLVLENSKVVVIWGANPLATLKLAYTAGDSKGLKYFEELKKAAKAKKIKVLCIDPMKSETIQFFEDSAEQISLTPNTDVALMLGIIHTMLTSGKYDKEFIETYTEGFEKFAEYVLGKTDKTPKDAKWASKISGVSEKKIKELAKLFFENRTMLMMGWNIQRQHHGEQAHWMAVTLASMIGQIGLAGGGFGISYHYSNGGSPTTNAPVLGGINVGKPINGENWKNQEEKEKSGAIPVARIADCLLNPGAKLQYNGREITYPEIDMIYWVGGNPMVHQQNLNKYVKAWKKPSTVVVHDMYWTPSAKMADIVFPIATPYERNDLTMTGDYSNLNICPMKQVVERMPKSKTDYEVFADLANACGFGQEFSEGGKSEMQWLEGFYTQAYNQAQKAGVLMADGNEMPDFATFWKNNKPLTFAPTPEGETYVRHAEFREDPILNPLGTPSGKIEIYSETIAKMNYQDCKAHPMWFEPIEWLGMKNKPAEFALISPHPINRLHSQLSNTSLRDQYAVADREPIWINPVDAKKKGIKSGDLVRVFNARGQALAGAVVSDVMPRGVVRIFEGAWYDPEDAGKEGSMCKNGCPNMLTLDIPTSELADANIASTALVNIEKFKGKAPKLTAFEPPKGAK